MRKIILVAAMVLVSASAQAGGPRSLSMAPANEKAAAPQPTTATTPAAAQVSEISTAPKNIDGPPAVSNTAPTAASTTTTATTKPSAPITARPAPKSTAKTYALPKVYAYKPKHKHYWTEARFVAELHRYGFYW
ncbi:hypothetical protein [Bradyrhizobium commune]|uniref:Uncharacterized protein n=1 Tax=Bradyrhizobium commune TaxID=83627 RepID=A0A7S9D6E3_9BRAD|nr:hypothetical protein [Bradyrhizobium commune]QPF91977.1 hypothetical protein IC761_01350 [Bradyrhizobium commune]